MNNFIRAYLYVRAIPKTLLFNFWYFTPPLAIRFPVLVSHRVWLSKISGKVIIKTPKTGGIRIGFEDVGIFDQHRSRTIWQVSGQIEFGGVANIGHGSKISVLGELKLGDKFLISAESSIVAHKSIVCGDNVLISWDVLIMDTDLHSIFDERNVCINKPKAIVIGNNVWIGCRALILKGVFLPDGSIIAAGSTITKPFNVKNTILGGMPARILKSNISWA